MRWVPFLILAYVALGLQLGLSGYDALHGGRPNLVLLVVIFVAAHAQRDEGLLACFCLGAVHDLLAGGPWGVRAFSYSLIGLFVMATQDVVYGDHFLTHFTRALLASWIAAIVTLLHAWLYRAFHERANWSRPGVVQLLIESLYTAVLAIPVMMLLQRTRRSFGFRAPRGGNR